MRCAIQQERLQLRKNEGHNPCHTSGAIQSGHCGSAGRDWGRDIPKFTHTHID